MTAGDTRLAEIRDRNQRLCALPFETHGENHGEGCVPCELVRAVGDVSWLLERVAHLDSARDSAVRAWKAEHDGADELQRERDQARAELEQLRTELAAADDPTTYRRWLTRNLGAAYAAGWETHAELVTGTLATLSSEKREQCGQAWVAERLADLTEDEGAEQQPEDSAGD